MLIKIDPKLGKAIHFPLHFPFLAIYYYVPIQPGLHLQVQSEFL